jgi:hypothetical protein
MSVKSDIQDAMLEAQAEVTEFMREFAQDLIEDDIITAMRVKWAGTPDEIKEQFKADQPQEYAAVIKQIQGA